MAKLTVDKVNRLIDEMMGNVSMVARTLNVSRTTLYNYINSHPTVKQALDEAREKMIDKKMLTDFAKNNPDAATYAAVVEGKDVRIATDLSKFID